MGCKLLPYWLGSLIFDFIMFLLIIIAFIILIYIFQLNLVMDSMADIVALMVCFSISFIALCYAGSFMFTKASTA